MAETSSVQFGVKYDNVLKHFALSVPRCQQQVLQHSGDAAPRNEATEDEELLSRVMQPCREY